MNPQPQKKRGQGIVKMSALFEKYKKTLRAPQKSVTTTFSAVVVEVIPGAHIESNQCDYAPRTRTLVVRAKGPLKTEIILRKGEILQKMTEILGERNVPREIL